MQMMLWLPQFLAAVIVFLLGLLIATVLGKLVEQLVDALKADAVIERMGTKAYFDRAGVKLDIGHFIGKLVFWFLVLAFLLASSDILRLTAVSDALRGLLEYIPNVIVAALILLATVLLANFLHRVTKSAATGAKLESASFVALIVRWAVFVFGFMAAVSQLGVAQDIINIAMSGMVAMLALAGGLAFGLGGKGFAEEVLERLKKELH